MFNETLRHFPPVISIPKTSVEDTVFTLTNAAGETQRVPVPRGTHIVISTPALHFNRTPPVAVSLTDPVALTLDCATTTIARYWDEPGAFRPERFLGDYPRDAFLPFSGGPRGCIGRGCVLLFLYLEH